MKRLIFVLGTWQMIQASVALRQESHLRQTLTEDILVLYGDDIPGETKKCMEEFSTILHSWERVVWIDDILTVSICAGKISNDLFSELRARIGIDTVEELWLCKIYNSLEKVAADSYKESRIVLYEDGLHFYVPQKTYSRGFNVSYLFHPLKLYKYIISALLSDRKLFRYNIRGVWPDHIDRLKKMYLLINRHLPIPAHFETVSIAQISTSNIISTFDYIKSHEKFRHLFKKFENKHELKTVLILAQNFSKKNSQLGRDDELNFYKNVVSRLIKHGFQVYWKEHPRVLEKFYPQILNELFQGRSKRFIEIEIPYSIPVELFITELNIIGCISCTSTALFHLPDLFGIPTYTIVHHFDTFKTKDFRVMADIVKKFIPPFELLFDQNGFL